MVAPNPAGRRVGDLDLVRLGRGDMAVALQPLIDALAAEVMAFDTLHAAGDLQESKPYLCGYAYEVSCDGASARTAAPKPDRLQGPGGRSCYEVRSSGSPGA